MVVGSTGNFLTNAASSAGLIAPRAYRTSSQSGLFSTPGTSTAMNAAESPGMLARLWGSSPAEAGAGSSPNARQANARAVHVRNMAISGYWDRYPDHSSR